MSGCTSVTSTVRPFPLTNAYFVYGDDSRKRRIVLPKETSEKLRNALCKKTESMRDLPTTVQVTVGTFFVDGRPYEWVNNTMLVPVPNPRGIYYLAPFVPSRAEYPFLQLEVLRLSLAPKEARLTKEKWDRVDKEYEIFFRAVKGNGQ